MSSFSRWLSSQFGRRRSRMSRTWFTSAERLRSCHPSVTHTSFLYMKVMICCMTNHTPMFDLKTHKQKHKCPKVSPPAALSTLVAKLQDSHIMTCRCHNKTWTTALGCYSSSVLCLAAWTRKGLDGFDNVHLDLSRCVCVYVCVHVC